MFGPQPKRTDTIRASDLRFADKPHSPQYVHSSHLCQLLLYFQCISALHITQVLHAVDSHFHGYQLILFESFCHACAAQCHNLTTSWNTSADTFPPGIIADPVSGNTARPLATGPDHTSRFGSMLNCGCGTPV